MSGSSLKVTIRALSLVACISTISWAQDDAIKPSADIPPILKIGAHAPDFNLPGVDGKTHSLREYASAKILAIVFTCDHCPVAQMYEKRIKQLSSDYADRGVKVVAIMPNDPKAIHLSELGHTDLSDSLEEMKLRAKYRSFNFPYLSDGETQKVALQYGPVATPHIFIFDLQRKLRYEGRIDSNAREELATKHEARDALDALLAGKPVAVEHAAAVGCSTKWAYKEVGAKQEIAEWEKEPAKVEMVSADQLKNIRKNAGTGRLLLVNFWATWCGPCTAEFPELQKMVRQYRKRDLDVVTLSINAPDEKSMVLKFLNEQHAINKNLLFNSADPAEAVPAFEAGWTGAVPFTALIGMNGEVLFKTQGGMNALEVRRAILKHLPDDRYVGQHAYWNSVF